MFRRIALALLCGTFVWGCSKSLSFSTVYVLKPLVQRLNQGPQTTLTGVQARAFAVDTTDWYVASYEDALAGVLTSKTAPANKITTPVAVSGPFEAIDSIPGSADWVQMSVDAPTLMIVAVDTENSIFAYSRQNFAENLSPIYVSVIFQPWREMKRYSYGPWVYVNDFYDPNNPSPTDYVLKPRVQAADKGEEAALQGVDLYAYAVDTTEWRIASYDDAVLRKITSKSVTGQTKTVPDYLGVPDKSGDIEGWRRLSSKSKMLMIVAVDPQHRAYAYRRLDMAMGSIDVVETLVFRPWREVYLYVESGWRVVVDNEKEPDPETPESKKR